ncbi:MAG: 23S rRNA (adenine(2503)-C(2))-methyltransferase RlmN, partial [Desulfobacterales bacterium]|nr:23S rRNA (adenine(2503)-C(2))-methyltransferase RlmN [Desulfobacterales bacterium]
AGQILKWVYLHRKDSFDMMTDLSKNLRNLLCEHFEIKRLDKKNIEVSKDGSKKYLFTLDDGNHIESVLIPEKEHYTLCISSQVGCAQGCKFCLTAKIGFIRNLKQSEIISQVRDIQEDINNPSELTNIVFMGMGEPLSNYKNVIGAINIFTDSDFGMRFSNRRITVSTAGLVSILPNLGKDTKVNLAISLNASNNNIRNTLMPINLRYPIEKLIDSCKNYSLSPRKRITFEYVLIKNINDSSNDAKELATLLRPIKSKINLIPYNAHEGSDFMRPNRDNILNFQEILIKSGYTVFIRESKGQDISAACGQLYCKS